MLHEKYDLFSPFGVEDNKLLYISASFIFSRGIKS